MPLRENEASLVGSERLTAKKQDQHAGAGAAGFVDVLGSRFTVHASAVCPTLVDLRLGEWPAFSATAEHDECERPPILDHSAAIVSTHDGQVNHLTRAESQGRAKGSIVGWIQWVAPSELSR